MPNGSVPAAQVAAAADLGQYMTACYGNPVASSPGGSGGAAMQLGMAVPQGASFDRVSVQEDIAHGQLVRGFTLTATLDTGANLTLASGPSIGHRFTQVLLAPVKGAISVTLTITELYGGAPPGAPFIASLALFNCSGI